jgi:hypothetical protein
MLVSATESLSCTASGILLRFSSRVGSHTVVGADRLHGFSLFRPDGHGRNGGRPSQWRQLCLQQGATLTCLLNRRRADQSISNGSYRALHDRSAPSDQSLGRAKSVGGSRAKTRPSPSEPLHEKRMTGEGQNIHREAAQRSLCTAWCMQAPYRHYMNPPKIRFVARCRDRFSPLMFLAARLKERRKQYRR